MVKSIIDIQKEWQQDPCKCAYALFVDRLTEQQEGLLYDVFHNREVYARSGHGFGKSYVAAAITLSFLYSFYPSVVLTLAPTFMQVVNIIWREIGVMWLNSKANSTEYRLEGTLNLGEPRLDLGGGSAKWFAMGLSPRLENIEKDSAAGRIVGLHAENQLIIADEASLIDERIWKAIETLMAGENCRLLAIGNPVRPAGRFYKGFRTPLTKKIKLSVFETPNFIANNIKNMDDLRRLASLSEEEIEEKLQNMKNPYPALITVRFALKCLMEWGENSPLFQSRILAEFPKQSSDSLIFLDDLERCTFMKDYNFEKTIKALGVDPARIRDRCVLFGLKNYKECFRKVMPGDDLMKIRNIIINVAIEEKFDIIAIDVAGLGIGLYDALIEAKAENNKIPAILPVNFGAKPSAGYEEKCANLITELWYRLSKLIEKTNMYLEDKDTLFNELVNRKIEQNNKGKLIIEDKKKYKERVGGYSPDIADGLLCALAGIFYGTIQSLGIKVFNRRVGGNLNYNGEV